MTEQRLTKKDLDRIYMENVKELVDELDQALCRERGGGSPLTPSEFLVLHTKARHFIGDGSVG
jgi:hypothetical protein